MRECVANGRGKPPARHGGGGVGVKSAISYGSITYLVCCRRCRSLTELMRSQKGAAGQPKIEGRGGGRVAIARLRNTKQSSKASRHKRAFSGTATLAVTATRYHPFRHPKQPLQAARVTFNTRRRRGARTGLLPAFQPGVASRPRCALFAPRPAASPRMPPVYPVG